MTLAVLVGVALGFRACLSAFFVDCWDDETDLPSPDSRYIARRLVHTCEGPSAANLDITQTVEIGRAGVKPALRVFESDEDSGAMHWDDNNNLSIEVRAISTIRLSLHEADGIRVTYHVPSRLVSLKIADDSDRETEDLRQAGKLTDSDYETEKKVNRSLRRWQQNFIEWAAGNASIDR